MPNAKHLHFVLDDFVHGNVGPWSKDQLARVRHRPMRPRWGKSRKLRHPSKIVLATFRAAVGLSVRMCSTMCCRGRRLRRSSSERGSRLEKPVDASNHFVVFQQCAATGGSPAFLDCGGEARFVLEQAVNRFLNHLRGGFAESVDKLSPDYRVGAG